MSLSYIEVLGERLMDLGYMELPQDDSPDHKFQKVVWDEKKMIVVRVSEEDVE